MYRIQDYGDMLLDRGRSDAYAAAIRARVTRESVVLDLGAGTGLMTLLACQAGARRVYAVEPNNAIQMARESVAANGFEDRVDFFHGLSTTITLPEAVDVIVSDVRGVLPLHAGSVASIMDARDRFLKPGGHLIPARDTVWGSVAAAEEMYARIVTPWESLSGLTMESARRLAVNADRKWYAAASSLMTESAVVAVIDYTTVGTPNVSAELELTARRSGTAHGIVLWFDCEAAPGCGFSNAPGAREPCVYGQALLPWIVPVTLDAGDRIALRIRAGEVGSDYVWTWETLIRTADGREPKARFKQSTFDGVPLALNWLRRTSASFVASPNRDAEIDRWVLDRLFSGASLGGIAEGLAAEFPDRFPTWQRALTRVGELSLRYSL